MSDAAAARTLQRVIAASVAAGRNVFDDVVSSCANPGNRLGTPPAHSLPEMRALAAASSSKAKGDAWECFCVCYLRVAPLLMRDVWLLRDVPDETLQLLALQRQDCGIDIVARDDEGRYYAVQCKFRSAGGCVAWRELATFYALVGRTGPFHRHVVMTNCRYVRRVGRKTEKDLVLGEAALSKLVPAQWMQIATHAHATASDPDKTLPSPSRQVEMRLARLRKFSWTEEAVPPVETIATTASQSQGP